MSKNSLVKAIGTETNNFVKVFEGHSDMVRGVAISPVKPKALSCGYDQVTKLWDLNNGVEINTFPLNASGLQFFSDDKRALIGQPQNLTLLDINNGSILANCHIVGGGLIDTVILAPDESFAIFKDLISNNIYTWNFYDPATGYHNKNNKRISAIAMTPDGKTIFAGWQDKSIKSWDRETNDIIQAYEGAKRSPLAIAYHNNKVIAAHEMSGPRGADNIAFIIWDAQSGELLSNTELKTGHKMNINCIAFSPDLTCVLTGSVDKTLRLNRLDLQL